MFVVLGLLELLSLITFLGNPKLRLLDHYEISANTTFDSTPVGGLSGIDYDRESNMYFMISDDRSERAPARFYKAKIHISDQKIDTVFFESWIGFQQQNDDYFKNEYCDFESIRYQPDQNLLYVGNEGGKKGTPGLLTFDLQGNCTGRVALNKHFLNNLRPNKAFESLSFNHTNKNIFFVTESTLINEPEPSSDNGATLKIEEVSISSNKSVVQLNYYLSPLPQQSNAKPPWNGSGVDNGISDILTINESEMIVIERSGAYQSNGSFHYISRVFCIRPNAEEHNKKLLYDFSQLGNGWNIEGVCFGPIINGQKTLIFISDNNFRMNSTGLFLFSLE